MANLFKKIYIYILIVAAFILLFSFKAGAEKGSIEDRAWHRCAQNTVAKYDADAQKNPNKFERQFCAFMNQKPGLKCKQAIINSKELGLFKRRMWHFALQYAITPACGPHPRD